METNCFYRVVSLNITPKSFLSATARAKVWLARQKGVRAPPTHTFLFGNPLRWAE